MLLLIKLTQQVNQQSMVSGGGLFYGHILVFWRHFGDISQLLEISKPFPVHQMVVIFLFVKFYF